MCVCMCVHVCMCVCEYVCMCVCAFVLMGLIRKVVHHFVQARICNRT